jgi:hypothetical protein
VRVDLQLTRLLVEHGLVCSRVPLSGAAGGPWSGDIDLELVGRSLKVEVKARHAFPTLYRWINSADLLLLKADCQQPLVVMPLDLLTELAAAKPAPPATPNISTLISLDVVPGRLFCRRGHELDSFCLLRRPDGSALLVCRNCEAAEPGSISADLEVRE